MAEDSGIANLGRHVTTGSLFQSWYVLALLVVGYATYILDKSVVSVLIEPIKKEFGMSDSQISLLTGLATSAPFALVCVPVGVLADRTRRKRLLVALVAGWSLATGMAGLATTMMMLFAARIGVGAFEAGYTPLSMSVLSDLFPRRLRATAMGIYGLGAPLGIFLGMGIGGFIAAAHGWRAAFFIAGIPGLLLCLLVALTVREPTRGRHDDQYECKKNFSLAEVLANMWSNRPIFHIVSGMMWCAVLPSAMSIWTPTVLIRVYGLGMHNAGLDSAFVVGVCGAMGAAAGGCIADRVARLGEWRKFWVPAFGTTASVVFALIGLLLVRNSLGVTLIMLGATMFFVQFFTGAGFGGISNSAPVAMRGTMMSVLLMMLNFVSYGLGTTAVGFVSDALRPFAGQRGIAWGLATTCIFSAVGVFHFWRASVLLRSRSKDAAIAAA